MISYAATVVSANRVTKDCFCAMKPAMIVESKPATRYSIGFWLLALLRMLAEMLLINGRGLNARAFGDPAVQGPKMSTAIQSQKSTCLLTSLVCVIFLFSFQIVSCIGR